MRKKLFGKLLSVALSATMAVTSAVPAYAAVDDAALTGEETESSSGNEAGDVNETPEAAKEIGQDAESDPVVGEVPGDAQEEEAPLEEEPTEDALEEASNGVASEEVEEEAAAEEEASLAEAEKEEKTLLESVDDYSITFTNNSETAALYVLEGDTIKGYAGAKIFNSNDDYEFFIAPHIGYELSATPVTVSGSYTPKDGGETITFAISDIEIGSMSEDEISLASGLLDKASDGVEASNGDFVWSEGKKITIKGGSDSFFGKYAATKLAGEAGFVAGTFEISANAQTAKKFSAAIYKYDSNAEAGEQITKVNAIGDIDQLKYGSGFAGEANIGSALSEADWANYDESVSIIKTTDGVKQLNNGVEFTKSTTDGYNAAETNAYVFDNDHKVYLNKKAINAAYEYVFKNENTEFAIVLTKKETAKKYGIIVKDTNFVDFTYNNNTYPGSDEWDGTTFDIKNAKGANIYALEVTSSGSSAPQQNTRALKKNSSGNSILYYQFDNGDKTELAINSGTWKIPAITNVNGAKSVTISAQTTETVKLTEANYSDSNKISVEGFKNATGNDATLTGDSVTGVTDSGEDFSFAVSPVDGYYIDSVKYTMYETNGVTTHISNAPLEPVDGVYTIKNVIGYVDIQVTPKQLEGALNVKTAEDYGSKATITDYKTGKAINNTAKELAEADKEYAFSVIAKAGYSVNDVTAEVNDTNLEVTKSETLENVYTLTAPSGGTINITVEFGEKIDVIKVANTYASVSLNDTALSDGSAIKFDKNVRYKFDIAGINGANIEGVYYAASTGLEVGDGNLHEITKADSGYYELAPGITKAYSDKTMYIYVATTRDAIQGTDFTVKFTNNENAVDGGKVDVTSGITLYASSLDTINSVDKKKITATFTINGNKQQATGYQSESEVTYASDMSKKITTTSVTGSVCTITPNSSYLGGAADQATDKLNATYSATGWNAVTYAASANINILPLKSYESASGELTLGIVTNSTKDNLGVAEDEIRVGSTDTVTLQVGYYENSTFTAPTGNSHIKNVTMTVTPAPDFVDISSADKTYTTTFNAGNLATGDYDKTLQISGAKKAQDLTVTANVTFADGTKTELTKVIKAVDNVYGYFAIPTTVINGVTTVNNAGGGNQVINLETYKADGATSINSTSVTYDVYKVISNDNTALGYLNDSSALNSADEITTAKDTNKYIELVNPDNVTWTDPVSTDYYTVTGSKGAYTITAKARNSSATNLGFAAKVGNYKVNVYTAESIKVNTKLSRRKVTINVGDSAAITNKYPEFTDEYLESLGYKAEEKLDTTDKKIEAYQLVEVTDGAVITLPDVNAFKAASIDPKRSLAGWTITHSSTEYKKADGTDVTPAVNSTAMTITAIWGNKYKSNTVKFIDADKETELVDSTTLGINTSIPVAVQVEKLDPAPTTPGNTAQYKTAEVLSHESVAENIEITSSAGENSKFTLTNGTIAAGAVATTATEDLTFKWTNDGAEYTGTKTGFGITSQLTSWTVTMDPIEIELGQVYKKAIALKEGDADTHIKTAEDNAKFKVNPTFVSSDTSVVTVELDATDTTNKETFIFTGLAVGETTAVFKFTDALGQVVTKEVAVKVKEPSYNIVAKLTPVHPAGAIETPTEQTLGENDIAYLPIGQASKIALSLDKTSEIEVSFTSTDIDGTVDANVTVSGSDKAITVNPAALGTSTIKVTATVNPDGKETITYVREIPVVSYGLVKVNGPLATGVMRKPTGTDGSGNITWGDTSLNQKNAFKAYTSATKATEIGAGKFAVIPVYYDADSQDSYAVENLASYTAEWIDTTLAQTFLGWGETKASEKASTAEALAGEALTLTASNVVTGVDLYAYFKESAITLVGGYNKVIDLSDAKIGETDRGNITVRISPAASSDTIGVYADKTGIIDIKTTSSTTVVDGIAVGTTFDPGTGAWNGGTIVSANKAVPSDRTAAYSPDTFFIGKLTNKTPSTYKGVGKVTLSLTNNGEILDTITVYANGEYTEGGKTYYMYRGEIQKNYSAVVDPSAADDDEEIHYYGADGALVENGPFYVESDGRWVLIKNNAKVETVGKNVVSGKTYYVDGDGYIMTDLFKGLISAGTNADVNETYYADPSEDPYLVNSKLVEVDGVSYYFDNNEHMVKASASANEYEPIKDTDYYVNKNGEIAKGGIFEVENVDRLFRDDYKIVSYTDSDVDPDDRTIDVGNTTYVISENDNKAEEDKLFEKESAEWAWSKASDGKTYASATVTFTSKEGKTKEFTVLSTETNEAAAKYMKITPYDGYTEYTVYASFKSKGTTIEATETKYLDADGNDYTPDTYYDPVVAWGSFPTAVKKTDLQAGVYPTVLYSVTYQKASGGEETVKDLVATITTSPDKSEITNKTDKVTLKATADLSKYFKDAEGKEVAENDDATWVYLFGTSDDSAATEDISDGKGIYISGLEPEYDYTGNAIQPVFDVIDASGSENLYLAKGVDYTVTYKNNKNVTTDTVKAQIIVKGKGNYTGQSATATFDITNPSAYVDDDCAVLTGATLKLPSGAMYYTGEEVRPTSLTLKLKGSSEVVYTLDDGVYYDANGNVIPAIVTFSNNINKGTATVLLTGNKGTNGKYTTLKKTYSIKAADINDGIMFRAVSPVDWAVKGAIPEIEISWNEMGLIEGQDYKLSFANNKKIATATITVTGKGNFSGTFKNSETEKFTVEQLDLEKAEFASADVYAGLKAGSVKATILDSYGDVIPASKYTIAVYPAGEESALATSAKLEAGKEYTVTAVAKKTNNIEIKGEISKDVVVASNKFSSAKVTLTKGYTETYTGEPIYVENEDFSTEDKISNITVTYKINGKWVTLIEGEDFEIAGHTNNVKKGKMTVTLRGLDNTEDGTGFSGTKTFKVTIAAKSMHD